MALTQTSVQVAFDEIIAGLEARRDAYVDRESLINICKLLKSRDTEVRDATSLPTIKFVTGGVSIDPAPPVAKTLVGSDFLQGQALDTLVSGTGTASVTVKANRPGTSGLSIAFVDGASAGVAYNGTTKVITVTYRGATNSNTDKAQAVRDLINADATVKKLVTATAGGNANFVAATAVALAGGTGSGLVVTLGGIAQDIIGTPTETTIPMSTVTLTGMASGDIAALAVTSNGVRGRDLAVTLLTPTP